MKDVIYENLRPPTPPEEMKLQTNGRKSSKAKKKIDTNETGVLEGEDEDHGTLLF